MNLRPSGEDGPTAGAARGPPGRRSRAAPGAAAEGGYWSYPADRREKQPITGAACGSGSEVSVATAEPAEGGGGGGGCERRPRPSMAAPTGL